MKWKIIRIFLYITVFINGIVTDGFGKSSETVLDMSLVEYILFIVFSIIPGLILPAVLTLIIVGIQAKNPLSDKYWEIPTHDKNPLYFKNPLIGLHFFAYCFLFMGLGIIVSNFGKINDSILFGVSMIFASIGFMIGIKKSIKTYKNKFKLPTKSPNNSGNNSSI